MILPGLLGIMITHSRETYQPTSIMRWDRGIFNGSTGWWFQTFSMNEIVDFPMNSMVDLSSLLCERRNQRVYLVGGFKHGWIIFHHIWVEKS